MTTSITRREAMKTGAALILGFYVPLPGQAQSEERKLNAWISITPDDQITVLTETPEMGQGTRTTNAMMLADELEAEWSAIRFEQAPTIPAVYKHLTTGGSGGTASTWLPLRQAGAQAREMLVTAAAQKWNANNQDCRAENGTIVHAPTGRQFRYGELVETASQITPVKLDQVPLKNAKDFRIIGKAVGRVDTPSKVDGSAVFGLDVRVPGMLFAVIARCPHFGGKLLGFDDSDAKTTPGVKAVFAVPPIGFVPAIERNLNVAGGVAVVATSTWAALEGRKALNITWDKGPGAQESTASLQEQFREKAGGPPSVVSADRGNVSQALANAAKKIEADYEMPFQAHAPMEPMNTTVHVRSAQSGESKNEATIEVWSPTQGADMAQRTIAHLAGIAPENVIVHMTFSGGSFGRRYQWDYLAESYQVAKEMKVPVQLVWTREDDMQHDFYLQYSYQRLAGALDSDGNIVAWSHRIVSTPIRAIFDSPELLRDPKHVASADVTSSIPYQALHYRSDYAPVVSVVPRAWWRSVSSPFHVFAVECFVDELAHAAGHDPYEFRIKNLRADQPQRTAKFRAVLQLAAEKSEWGKPLPANCGRGIACSIFGETYVAYVAEVCVENGGTVRVNRIVSAVDCGLAVNPDSVRAQIEGGINFALTPVLSGEISVKEGAVEQSNFHNYQVLRMKDAPDIEVHLVPGADSPSGGVGEGGVPPLAPAIANAIFAATGKRVRRLPISKIV
ncbi:MAG TPA: molybdopterin cofactor-binding domain-containing protein [Bryobacteraceae bacterium]|nr:molybdopterin cofactor-binding domain-containing protein [Bryobacteraceae bacterium]